MGWAENARKQVKNNTKTKQDLDPKRGPEPERQQAAAGDFLAGAAPAFPPLALPLSFPLLRHTHSSGNGRRPASALPPAVPPARTAAQRRRLRLLSCLVLCAVPCLRRLVDLKPPAPGARTPPLRRRLQPAEVLRSSRQFR
jgi:hypothetical protein